MHGFCIYDIFFCHTNIDTIWEIRNSVIMPLSQRASLIDSVVSFVDIHMFKTSAQTESPLRV